MRNQCKPDIFKLVLMLALLLALIYVLSTIGCTEYSEILFEMNEEVGVPVNENVWSVFNKDHLKPGNFLIEAGETINAKAKYHGWKINRVRIEGSRNLVREYEIRIIWVYYD